MRRALVNQARKLKPCGSVRIDVDVDLVGNVDVGGVSAEPDIAAEHVQQHEHDDDQQHDGDYSAAAATAAGIHYGCALDFVAVVIGHGNSPCSGKLSWRNERTAGSGVPAKGAVMRRISK